jgi:hypothetical protein
VNNKRGVKIISTCMILLIFIAIIPCVPESYSLKNQEQEQNLLSDSSHQNYFVPNTFFINSTLLAQAKKIFQSNESKGPFAQEVTSVIQEAKTYVKNKPTSVMDKNEVPPSGTKHDFLSLTPYRWPNPNTQSGLPYVFRDGKTNPEAYKIPDKHNLDDMIVKTKILSLAYYFTDNLEYAKKAAELLRVWFLNNDTRMNPNLQFSEMIRGKSQPNPSGVIAGAYIPHLFDAISIIESSSSWSNADREGIRNWFNQYLQWLLSSEAGKLESMKINNHGTYYDVQVASVALFLNKQDLVKKVLQNIVQMPIMSGFRNTPQLLSVKITPEGKQPFELSRTNSLDYSMFNLIGFFNLAQIGEHVGLNLWDYKTSEGAGLRKALDYLLPYFMQDKTWPYEQQDTFRKEYVQSLLCMASISYDQDNNNQTYFSFYKSLDAIKIPLGMDNYGICVKNPSHQ